MVSPAADVGELPSAFGFSGHLRDCEPNERCEADRNCDRPVANCSSEASSGSWNGPRYAYDCTYASKERQGETEVRILAAMPPSSCRSCTLLSILAVPTVPGPWIALSKYTTPVRSDVVSAGQELY